MPESYRIVPAFAPAQATVEVPTLIAPVRSKATVGEATPNPTLPLGSTVILEDAPSLSIQFTPEVVVDH